MKHEHSKFEDVVRFNWGYHDAAHDVRRGKERKLVLTGEQSLEVVSLAFDVFYYGGYEAGLQDAKHGFYNGDSEEAWLAWCAA